MLSVLLEVAPWLAGLVAGGKGKEVATIGAKVAREIFGTDDPTKVEAAIQNPHQLEAFKARLEQETAAMQAELADVQDARAQTVALASSGSAISWAAPIVSVVITVGFFAVMALLFFSPTELPPAQANLLNVLFGALIPSFGQVVNYWLGSSAGSKRSGDAVRAIAEKGVGVAELAKQVAKAVE